MENDERFVMVVDDDPVGATLVSRLLKLAGYRSAAVHNSIEALSLVKKVRPDLVISDLKMPDLDGSELCTLLKSAPETREIPVVLLSAYSGPEIKEQAEFAGAAAFVEKPYRNRELLDTIRDVMERTSI